MNLRQTRNKEEIFEFLSQSPGLQLYLIGDLDDFFWPHTKWFALYNNARIISLALLYSGMTPPTLLLFHEGYDDVPKELLKAIIKYLPRELFVQLSPGLLNVFGKTNIIKDYGRHYRMILEKDPEVINEINIRRLTLNDIKALNEIYDDSYPDNWFDSRMLETGKYFGYFTEEILIGAAGIHVYSPEYRIAALGNIVTRKEFREKKIAYKLTSVLCHDLKVSVDTIGLNVKSDNNAAIKCYQNVGFKIRSSFFEYLVRT